jgi:hypothetical protein
VGGVFVGGDVEVDALTCVEGWLIGCRLRSARSRRLVETAAGISSKLFAVAPFAV